MFSVVNDLIRIKYPVGHRFRYCGDPNIYVMVVSVENTFRRVHFINKEDGSINSTQRYDIRTIDETILRVGTWADDYYD